jgi:hypothetical protein
VVQAVEAVAQAVAPPPAVPVLLGKVSLVEQDMQLPTMQEEVAVVQVVLAETLKMQVMAAMEAREQQVV